MLALGFLNKVVCQLYNEKDFSVFLMSLKSAELTSGGSLVYIDH